MLVSGCAFTTGHVNVAYESSTQATRIAGANTPHVIVEISDRRTTQVVGQKINGFGMKTADIVSDSDVPAALKSAFETELKNRGFVEGAGGNLVAVRLDNFQNQFTLGFFSGEGTASIGMDVAVKRANGSTVFNQYITGEHKDWIGIAGEDNAQLMLNGAMRDAVSKVFNDSAFIDALKQP
jgi:uncharacterized lipoprotein YajG